MQFRKVGLSWKCCTAEQSLMSFQIMHEGVIPADLASTRHTTLRARICGKDRERMRNQEMEDFGTWDSVRRTFDWTFLEKAAAES